MSQPRAFISFEMEDRWARDFLAQHAKDENNEIEFYDYSVKDPFDSKWKTECEKRIGLTTSANRIEQKLVRESTTPTAAGKNNLLSPLDFPDMKTPPLPDIFRVGAVFIMPDSQRQMRLKQLAGAWGLFEHVAPLGADVWYHIPNVPGPWVKVA